MSGAIGMDDETSQREGTQRKKSRGCNGLERREVYIGTTSCQREKSQNRVLMVQNPKKGSLSRGNYDWSLRS